MSQTIRLHLDENVDAAIGRGLRMRGINVTTTQEAGLIAFSDEAQIEFAFSQGRVIFTQDRDFLRLHNAGVSHTGIVYCIKGSRSVGEVVRNLTLIWEVLEPEDICGRVEFI